MNTYYLRDGKSKNRGALELSKEEAQALQTALGALQWPTVSFHLHPDPDSDEMISPPALEITTKMREVASDALGREVEDSEFRDAWSTFGADSVPRLLKEVGDASAAFARGGGRGVELADHIDRVNIALVIKGCQGV